MMMCRVRVLCTALVVVIGCSSASDGGKPVQEWQAKERVTIGVVDGDPTQEFGRVTGVVKLRDGRIVVADHQALELRIFSAEGDYLQSVGRRGRGPGEFLGLTRLIRLGGDTLVAGSNLKITTFAPGGALVGERTMEWPDAVTQPMFIETQYPLNEREFILYAMMSSAGQPDEQPLSRSPVMYLIADSETGVTDTLGAFSGLEQMTYRDIEGSHTAVPLFPASTALMIGTEYVVVGDRAADSVLIYNAVTKQRSWVQLPLSAQPIPEAVRQDARNAACNWTSDEQRRRRCELSYGALPEQREFPVFDDVAVDSSGALWVKQYPVVPQQESATWLIVQPNGAAVASIKLPTDMRLMQIGGDYLVGLLRDELGVQFVKEYVIER